MRIHPFAVLALSLGILAPAATAAADPFVIHSTITSSPTSDVPGIPGAKFTAFERPYRSPDGMLWIINASTDLPAASNEIVLTGNGITSSVGVREGNNILAPNFGPVELVGIIDRNLFITNAGDFVYATNTDAATTMDEVIGRFRAGLGYDVPIREGNPAPGLPGVTLGLSIHSPYVADDGRVGFVGTSLIGTGSTSTDSAVFFGKNVVAQEGITVPGNQAGGGAATWQIFDSEDTYFANNGATHLIRGDTNAAVGDDVLVFNGNVVLQETQVIPGSGFTSPIATGGPAESILTPNGDWYARGSNVDAQDWVVRNGVVLAATDEPVPGGQGGETFDDAIFAATFFNMTGNNVGDTVYGGVTNAADVNANAVLVFNDSFVFLREGDRVDLNGNGLPDDDAFVSVFNNENSFLTDDLMYFFTADLRNAAGTALGQAYLAVPIPEPGALSLVAVCAVGLLRRRGRR